MVNNAGITRHNLVMKMNDEEFDAVYETNLKGVFHTIIHTSRYFLKQKSGRIINISSVSGITGNAGQANYCAAKAGVIGLTKSVARELSSRGITANVVAPGMIETDMTKDLPDTVKENMLHNIPLGRIGKPGKKLRRSCILSIRRGRLYHRTGAGCRWRNDYVDAEIILADEKARKNSG